MSFQLHINHSNVLDKLDKTKFLCQTKTLLREANFQANTAISLGML